MGSKNFWLNIDIFYEFKLEPFAILFSYDIFVSLKKSKEISLMKWQYCRKIRQQTAWALEFSWGIDSFLVKCSVLFTISMNPEDWTIRYPNKIWINAVELCRCGLQEQYKTKTALSCYSILSRPNVGSHG